MPSRITSLKNYTRALTYSVMSTITKGTMLRLQNLILHLGQLGLDVPLQLRGFFWERVPQLSLVGVEN